MSFTEAVLEGFAQLLEDAGAALFDASGNYPAAPSLPVVSLSGMPAAPDRVYSLTVYPVTDDPAGTDSTVGLQVISRGTTDKRTSLAMDDAAFDAFHGREQFTLPTGVHVVQVYRRSGTGLGPDKNRRHEQSSNFYVELARHSTHRTD